MNAAAAKIEQVAQQEKDMRVKEEVKLEVSETAPENKVEEPVKEEEKTA